MTYACHFRWALLVLVLVVAPAAARTITLTAEDCDQMAVVSAKYPRMSWACIMPSPKVLNTENQIHLAHDMAILMQFSLAQVPKDSRITKAEFTLPVAYVAGKGDIAMRRLVAQWGLGVCHEFRQQYPKKLEWAQPGGRGGGTDRATKNSAIFKIDKVGDFTADVTEDIELWHTGAIANRGWIFHVDSPGGPVYTAAPYSPHHGNGAKRWKLQITYEPQ